MTPEGNFEKLLRRYIMIDAKTASAFKKWSFKMSATTSEGTGHGSAADILPKILNGVVKDVNISHNALDMYSGLFSVSMDGEENPIANIGGDLYVDGDQSVEGDIYGDGNVEVSGFVRGSAAGQLLNTQMYTFSSGNLTSGSASYTDMASVSYTPVHGSSKLWIEYHAPYTVSGNGTDDFRSRITVNGTEITYRDQKWGGTAGTGTRSSVCLPISHVYQNSGTGTLTIKVQVEQNSANDNLTVDTNGASLRVSEFAS
jgi:hypothetical protein